jgi:hypothetical protein
MRVDEVKGFTSPLVTLSTIRRPPLIASPDRYRPSTKGRRKPSQEEEGKEQQDSSHSSDNDLHDADELTVVMHVLCIVVLNVLSCYGHRNLHRLSIPMIDDFRQTQAMVAYSIVCALIQVKGPVTVARSPACHRAPGRRR